MDKIKAKEIVNTLSSVFLDKPALTFNSPYQLLIAVILSAQCTDERVNKVTDKLFVSYGTPETMLTLSQEQLENYIFSCGLYKNKAKHILSATKDILERFNGQVPSTLEQLNTLAGVGRKTANVVTSVAFAGEGIAVDTHVFRTANRLGLANAKTPFEVEKQLREIIPQNKYTRMHHLLIFHGRYTCKSQNPDCKNCNLYEYCVYENKKIK